jgi:hypothetical protein
MKSMKTLSQDSQSLGRDLNPRAPKYDAGVPTIWLQCSVAILIRVFYLTYVYYK